MEKIELDVNPILKYVAITSLSKEDIRKLCEDLDIPYEGKNRERMATLISQRIEGTIKLTFNIQKKDGTHNSQ